MASRAHPIRHRFSLGIYVFFWADIFGQPGSPALFAVVVLALLAYKSALGNLMAIGTQQLLWVDKLLKEVSEFVMFAAQVILLQVQSFLG